MFLSGNQSAINLKYLTLVVFSVKNQFISSISVKSGLFLIYCILKRFISVSKLEKDSILFYYQTEYIVA